MYKTSFLLALMTTAICGFVYTQTGDRTQTIARGKEAYTSFCMNCHMENGEGQPNVYPPLAKGDVLMKQPKKTIGMI
jgi:mono/diheme cytochrome c family protein